MGTRKSDNLLEHVRKLVKIKNTYLVKEALKIAKKVKILNSE